MKPSWYVTQKTEYRVVRTGRPFAIGLLVSPLPRMPFPIDPYYDIRLNAKD